jgi:RHS repeat-associated protein
MKKSTIFWVNIILTFFLLANLESKSQSTTTIGNVNTTYNSEKYPFNGYYNYSWSNMIYLNSEVGASGQISKLSFYVTNAPSNYLMTNQKIYARHTSASSYTNSNYPGTSGFTLVYDGSITYSGSGWKTITLTNSFAYDGTSNLEFLFENRDGTYAMSFPYFAYTTSTGSNRLRRDYQDSNFPTSCYYCSSLNSILNIQITRQCASNMILTASSSSICSGNSATLTAAGALTYTWEPVISLTTNSGTMVIASPTATTIYTITGADASNCIQTQTIAVNILALPSLSISASATNICSGSTSTLSATGASNYSWSPSTALNATTGSSVFSNPSSAIIYTVTGTDANNCVSTKSIALTATENPTLKITPNTASFCNGISANLSATGATSYTWSPSTGLNTAYSSSVIANPISSTIYTITGLSNGCYGFATTTVSVSNVNTGTAKASGSDNTCSNNSASLSLESKQTLAIGTGTTNTEKYPFNGYYNYSWSDVIYTQSEVGSAGLISKIFIYVDNTPSNFTMNSQTIYVKNTSVSSFTNSNYPGTNGFTQVYNGTITYNGSGWKEITLTTPFNYNGIDNLEVLFENRDGSWATGFPTFKYSPTSANRVKRDYADASFPTSCSTCASFASAPNVMFTIDRSLSNFVKWQYSFDDITYTDLLNATTSNFNTTVNSSTYFRAQLTNGTCDAYSIPAYYVTNNNYYVNDNSTVGDIYTSAIGNSTNDGRSASKPKSTISEILATYTLNPCDTIFVDKGNYTEEVYLNNQNNLNNYGFVTIQGAGIDATVLNAPTGKNNIYLNQSNNIKIEKFTLNSSQSSYHNLKVFNSKNNLITNNKLTHSTASNIYVSGSTIASNNNTISENEIINSSTTGNAIIIVGNTDSLSVQSNTISLSNSASSVSGIYVTSSSVSGNVYYPAYGVINQNTITAQNYGVKLYGIDYSISSYSISNNQITVLSNSQTDGAAIWLGYVGNTINDQTLVYSNKLNGGKNGIYLSSGVDYTKIYNNYVSGSDNGLFVSTSTSDIGEVYYNSFYNTTNNLYFAYSSSAYWKIKNNILYNTSTSASSACIRAGNPITFLACNNNLYYAPNGASVGRFNSINYATLANWQTIDHADETPLGDENSKYGNPLFSDVSQNNLDISSSSPAATSGTLIASITNDIYGALRSNPPFIGAQEFPLAISICSNQTITCASPSVTLTGFSSTPGLIYLWVGPTSGGSSPTSTLTIVSAPGIYTLTANNPNSTATTSVTVQVFENITLPNISVGSTQVISASNLSVTLTGNSTTPNVTYSWSPAGTTPTNSTTVVSSAGVYTLTLINPNNGCHNSDTVTVFDDIFRVSVLKNHATIESQNSGIIAIIPSGGKPPYKYLWNDISDDINMRSNLTVGNYNVTVKDSLNDSLKICVSLGFKNKWRLQENVNIYGDVYKKNYNTDDSTAILVSNNSVHANNDGWTDITVLNRNQSIIFGFLGFNSNELDVNSVTPYVTDESLNTSLAYADSIVNNRFSHGTGIPLSSKLNFSSIHLVELTNGIVKIKFQDYDSTLVHTYDKGDVFKMQRTAGLISIYKNNILLASENSASTTQHLLSALFIKSDTTKMRNSGSLSIIEEIIDARMYSCSDDNLNWVSSISYDENEIIKSESKVYMDGLGRTIQTQSKLLSDQNVLVSEPMFDSYGRAIGQTLPAPSFKNYFCYISHFIEIGNNSQNAVDYSNQFFDKPVGIASSDDLIPINDFNAPGDVNNPYPVDNTNVGKLGWYYSDNNIYEKLVPTDLIPYSRVEYYNDPLGRVKRVSGVGENHRMGSNHESKFIYTSTPAVSNYNAVNELNFVFPFRTYELEHDFSVNSTIANNVNHNLQLFKTIAINPDGKDQITYTNSSGKTIATCITGDGSGCVEHLDEKILFSNNSQKSIETIYIPKLKANSFKLYEQVNTSTRLYSNIVPNLKDIQTGHVLSLGTDFTYNNTNGTIAFLGNYTDKSLYLQLGFNFTDINYSLPINNSIHASVEVDYSQWTLYFYDRKGRLLANSSPNDVVCQTIPYSVQKTTITGGLIKGSNISSLYLGRNQTNPNLSFTLNSELKNNIEKEIYLDLNLNADTIFNFNLDSTMRALYSYTELNYDQNLLQLDSTIFFNITDSLNIITADSAYYINDEFDSLYVIQHQYPDTSNLPTSHDLLLHNKIRYVGYYTIDANLADNSVFTIDTIPFDYEIEAVSYDSLSGGVVCRVSGYKGPGNGEPELAPIHIDIGTDSDPIPPTTTTIDVHHHGQFAPINEDPVKLPPSNGPTGPTPTTGGGGLLSHAISLGLNLYANGFVAPPPIPINLTNKYFYDEFDRLIGSISEDEGRVDYIYDQLEDKLLFTQNDKQRLTEKFSCIAYDKLGRVIVTGEYDPNNGEVAPGAATYMFFPYNSPFSDLADAPILPDGRTSVLTLALNNNTSAYNDGHLFEKTHVEYDNADGQLSLTNFTQKHTAAKVSKTYNSNSTTWYSYDELGRLVKSVNYGADLGYKTMSYNFDFRGKLLSSSYQKDNTDNINHFYSYDADERLTNASFSSYPNNTIKPLANYQYYLHGPLKRTVLGGNLQGLDYVYTIGGMLKSVNNPYNSDSDQDPGLDGYATGPNANVSPDVFSYALQYYKDDYKRNSSPIKSYNYTSAFNGSNESYAGLIKNTTWRTKLPTGAPNNYSNALTFEYNYDDLYQLKEAQFGTFLPITGNSATFNQLPEYKLENLSYDKNGNMQTLKRYAAPNGTGSAHLLDDLTYNYSSTLKNRLLNVADAGTNTGAYTAEFDMPNQTNNTNYVYNQIGELIENKQENQGFEYNASGLTTRVFNTATNYNIAEFKYNDKGLRHSKKSYNTSGVATKITYYSYDAGGAQVATYTKDLLTTPLTIQLQDLTLYGAGRLGIYDATNQKEMYELSDHLGNVRAVVTKNTTTGLAETVSYTDYYPHGGTMPGRNYVNSLGVPFAYQGQEKDAETNLINFELRQYDARLGRWYNPDPMGQHHSPYLAMANNPVSSIDPNGGQDINGGINIDPTHGSDTPSLDARYSFDPTWMTMSPSDRNAIQSELGTSYESQQRNKILDLAFIGGYQDKAGNNWAYSARKNDIGTWMKDNTQDYFAQYKTGSGNGFMTGAFNYLNVAEKWFGLGYNGSEQKYKWAQRTYGGTGDGGLRDQLHYSFSTFNSKYNPIAHLVDAMNGNTDRFGNPQSTMEAVTKATSGVAFLFGGAIADAYVGAATAEEVTVYRVFGGDARAQGYSWTTQNPNTIGNFRNAAGLPSGGASGSNNAATFMIQGTVKSNRIISSRFALPLDGNSGGLIELIIKPSNVMIREFSVLKP